MWRKSWDDNRDPAIKARLVQYNQDDCWELRHIADFIWGLTSVNSATVIAPAVFKTTRTEELATDRPHWEVFKAKEYASEDLKRVAKCGYFDYQPDKVFVRTHPHFKTINKRHRRLRRTSLRVNKVDSIECERCPECRSKNIHKGKQMSHDLVDLKFFKGGVKKWITRIVSWRYSCSRCNHSVQFRREVDQSAQIWPRPLELVRLFQCRLRFEYESRREEPGGRIRAYE